MYSLNNIILNGPQQGLGSPSYFPEKQSPVLKDLENSESPSNTLSLSMVGYVNAFVNALQTSYNCGSDTKSSGTASTGDQPRLQKSADRKAVPRKGAHPQKKVAQPCRRQDLTAIIDDDILFAKQVVEHTVNDSVNWKMISKKQKSSLAACKERWNQIKKRQMRFLNSLDLSLPPAPQAPVEEKPIDIFAVLDGLVQDYRVRGDYSSAIILPDPNSKISLAGPTQGQEAPRQEPPKPFEGRVEHQEEDINDIDKFLNF
jgi:hypothetical protein